MMPEEIKEVPEQEEPAKESKVSEYELQLRKENEKRRKENDQLKKELEVLKAQLDEKLAKEREAELAKKDELERERQLRLEAEERLKKLAKDKEEAESLAKTLALTQKVKDLAMQLGFNQPEDAVIFLKPQMGNINAESDDSDSIIKDELSKLLQSRPYLKRLDGEEREQMRKSAASPTSNPQQKPITPNKGAESQLEELGQRIRERLAAFDGLGAWKLFEQRQAILRKLEERKRILEE